MNKGNLGGDFSFDVFERGRKMFDECRGVVLDTYCPGIHG